MFSVSRSKAAWKTQDERCSVGICLGYVYLSTYVSNMLDADVRSHPRKSEGAGKRASEQQASTTYLKKKILGRYGKYTAQNVR